MSATFREFLKKIGSGLHTGKDLTRQEAEMATRLMLLAEATPAQIGAFMIAHRIKRPTPIELAGMLDAYEQLGPKFQVDDLPFTQPVTVFGNPYDGRLRTAPVTPITALILASVGVPVLMHGGDCMPTKYGIPLIEIWQKLGVDFSQLSQPQLEQLLKKTGLTFVYLPKQFPLAQQLVPYREQLGKRPPLATLELIWSPYIGNVHVVAGFVHPPTEERFQEALALRGITQFTTVKGLEGSGDLACSRTAIIGLGNLNSQPTFERLLLNPRDYNFTKTDLPLESIEQLIKEIQAVVNGKASDLKDAAILNGGFYLWRFGICESLESGFTQAENLLKQGKVAEKLREISNLSQLIN
jgi:anthranilate phosphoribosyltransferase